MDEPKTFSYEEALATFPRIRERTVAAVREVESLIHRLQSHDELEEKRSELEEAHQAIVQHWIEDVTAAGCVVKGLWLVDWDNGAGYYCWKYPEESLSHFHTYDEGFGGRIPIA